MGLQAAYANLHTAQERYFFSSRRRHTISIRDWSSDVCSSDLAEPGPFRGAVRIIIELASQRFELRGIIRWVKANGMGVQFQSLGVREPTRSRSSHVSPPTKD